MKSNSFIARYLFLILVLTQLTGFSQLTANKLSHDFGEVNATSNRTVEFFVVNTYKFSIIPNIFSFDTEISSTNSPISVEPGDTAFFRVKIKPKKTGVFEKTIPLSFYRLSDTIPIILKAHVTSVKFTDYSGVEIFTEKPGKNDEPFKEFPVHFRVIDAETGLPIKGASVSFNAKSPQYGQLKTDAQGQAVKVLNNRYDVNFYAYGYQSRKIGISVGCSDSMRTVALHKNGPDDKSEADYFYDYEGSNPIKNTETDFENMDEAEEKALLTPLENGNYKPNNIVFLMDVSISMKDHNRMALLKTAIIQLINLLRPMDHVSVITFSENTKTIVPPTPISVENRKGIIRIIESLKPTGTTNGGKGLKVAFKLLNENYDATKNNQVILATDGALGAYMKHEDMVKLVEKNTVYGSTSVVTLNGYNWSGKLMQEIATAGKGKLIPINSENEARLTLIRDIKANSIIKTE